MKDQHNFRVNGDPQHNKATIEFLRSSNKEIIPLKNKTKIDMQEVTSKFKEFMDIINKQEGQGKLINW